MKHTHNDPRTDCKACIEALKHPYNNKGTYSQVMEPLIEGFKLTQVLKRGRKIRRPGIDKYICHFCNKWFTDEIYIEEHIERNHLD